MKIEVTQEDIDRAKGLLIGQYVSVAGYCPISQSVRRKRGVTEVSTAEGDCALRRNGRVLFYKLPARAVEFIKQFDAALGDHRRLPVHLPRPFPGPITFEARRVEDYA